jgi:hypothetical protein
MPRKDRLPLALRELQKVINALMDDADDDADEEVARVDLELYPDLLTPERTRDELRSWVGKTITSPLPFRPFGQDATGSLYCFWESQPDTPLTAQPIIYFGSEGDIGVVGRDLPDFLALLSRGVEPYDVFGRARIWREQPVPQICTMVGRHFPDALERSTQAMITDARVLNKGFKQALKRVGT